MDFLHGNAVGRSAPAENVRAGAKSGVRTSSSPEGANNTGVVFAELARSARGDDTPRAVRLAGHANEIRDGELAQQGSEGSSSLMDRLAAEIDQILGKLEDVAPGKTVEEAAIMKALQTRNLGNLEKAFDSLSADLSGKEFAETLGSLLGKFDADNGTNFLKNFTRSLEALNAKLDIIESEEGKSELLAGLFGTAESLTSGIARMMGVERPLGGGSDRASPFTRFVMLGADLSQEGARDRAPLTMPGLDHSKTTNDAGILKLFENVAEAGKAAKTLMSTPGASEANGFKPGDPFASRVDILNSLGNTASGTSVSQGDFEELLQKAAQGRSETSSASAQGAQAARFASLIANQLRNAQFSQNRMRVELAPRGLGEIEIDIETDAAGKLRAMIRVENPMVLDMLRSDKTQLHELLQSKGFQLSSDDLEFSERESGEGQGGDNPSQDTSAGDVSVETTETTETSGPQVISSSNIDIRI